MNLSTTLWHLQLIDQEIDVKTKRTRQVDEMLASDPEVATARASGDAAQQKLGAGRRALQDRELEAKSLDAKIKEINERLYGGKVSNPKELESLSKDLEMHKRNRRALDDTLLAAMDQVDQAQARAKEMAQSLESVEAKRAGDRVHLTGERESLIARLAELGSEREKTLAVLGVDSVRMYDRLRQTKAGRAVAQMPRGACSACGVTIPTGLKSRIQTGEEIVSCPSCGRILAP